MRAARTALAIILGAGWAALGAAACDGGDGGGGMPPASEWKPPAPKPSRVDGSRGRGSGTARGSASHDPSVAEGEEDPHAGLDMTDGEEPAITEEDPHGADHPEPGPNETVARGRIRAKGDAASAVKPGAVMYVTAVPVDPKTGAPSGSAIAVEKFEVQALPMQFELAGSPYEGEVLITAWTDGDGEARTREPGDVEGRLRTRLPTDKVDLVLDTVLR